MENITLPLSNQSIINCSTSLCNSTLTSIQDVTIDNTSVCIFSSAANRSDITEELYEHVSTYLYLMLIISSFGLVGNTLSFIVLIKMSCISSFYLYLAMLSLSDCAVLILLGLYQIESKNPLKTYHSPELIFYVIFSQYSSWITVALSVDRYIAVCHPLKVTIYCTKKRAIVTLVCVFLAIFALDFPLFCFEWDDDNTSCLFPAKSIHFNEVYLRTINLPTYNMVPIAVILVLSLLIIRRLYIANKHIHQLSNNVPSNRMKIKTATLKTMVLLLAAVLVFFITSLPLICVFIYTLAFDLDTTGVLQSHPTVIFILDISALLNHAVNFVLYGLSGQTIRGEFLHFFCRCCFRR